MVVAAKRDLTRQQFLAACRKHGLRVEVMGWIEDDQVPGITYGMMGHTTRSGSFRWHYRESLARALKTRARRTRQ